MLGQFTSYQSLQEVGQADWEHQVVRDTQVGRRPPAVTQEITALTVVLAGKVNVLGRHAGEEIPRRYSLTMPPRTSLRSIRAVISRSVEPNTLMRTRACLES
jgi:hypothetical protein